MIFFSGKMVIEPGDKLSVFFSQEETSVWLGSSCFCLCWLTFFVFFLRRRVVFFVWHSCVFVFWFLPT